MKSYRTIGMAVLAVLMCVGFTACSDDEINKTENNDSGKTEILTLFKRWYLTDFSSDSNFNWQSEEVVSWGEYMEFSEDKNLYWNYRMGGENTTYRLSGITSGSIIGSFFTAFNVYESDDSRVFTVTKMTEKYLLLYDSSEEMYRGFVASNYAEFSGNDENGGSNDSDDDDDDDDDDEEEEDSYRKCGVCHGSGKCDKCGGDGGDYIYGGDGWRECAYCDETGLCYVCGGTGWIKRD